MPAPVIMYASAWCGYCEQARSLLRAKGVAFTEIDVEEAPEGRREMIEKSGRRTVPQIFIGGRHIGGAEELGDLERSGGLDELLGAA